MERGGVFRVVLTLDNGHDGALLDSRGALETVSVDAYVASVSRLSISLQR